MITLFNALNQYSADDDDYENIYWNKLLANAFMAIVS